MHSYANATPPLSSNQETKGATDSATRSIYSGNNAPSLNAVAGIVMALTFRVA